MRERWGGGGGRGSQRKPKDLVGLIGGIIAQQILRLLRRMGTGAMVESDTATQSVPFLGSLAILL